MTDTNDRLTEIRARLDAATPAPWTRFARNASAPDEDDWYLGHDVHGPPRAQRGQIERVADAELIAHAPADLAHLLSLVEQLQGQLDEFATLQDRIPDDENTDWGLGWHHGYNAALAEVRAMAARETAQEHASGPNAPDPYAGEGTAPASPHEPAQAAIDTIARVLVGTDWDEEVPYTDIGPRETVAHLAGQIATVLAPGPAPITLAQAATALHGWARDLDDGARTDWPAGHPDIIRGIRAAADWLDAIRGIRAAADLLDNAARDLTEGTTNG